MTTALRTGQLVQDRLGSYNISNQLHRDVWTAIGTRCSQKYIVKSAPPHRLDNERAILKTLGHQSGVRRLVDDIQNPPLLVLQYYDDNLLNYCRTKSVEGCELKTVAKTVLQALAALHNQGLVHTDVKPDNIFINYSDNPKIISEVALGDFGDTCHVGPNPDPNEDGHIIGAGIFRSPEAMLNLRWGPPTDIWSFGATMNFFGPLPDKFTEIVDEERATMAMQLKGYVESMSSAQRKPFARAEDAVLTKETRQFLCRIMKLDPRDRPTANQLLGDEWFDGIQVATLLTTMAVPASMWLKITQVILPEYVP
ncbi:serine/threonine protein kinase [Histoplasma capsulatum var. duboisii H88]|uniref:Serine/threonine protein kinase n=2 Tax=Ajellomyces capsulatus (strain H88) TaxID=544711 RepID=F0UFS1_AJEC8|nr:serine/threonine protein kinase [Histoplasma capsulatum var. duboisii H88]